MKEGGEGRIGQTLFLTDKRDDFTAGLRVDDPEIGVEKEDLFIRKGRGFARGLLALEGIEEGREIPGIQNGLFILLQSSLDGFEGRFSGDPELGFDDFSQRFSSF